MSPRIANGFLVFDPPACAGGGSRNVLLHGDCRDKLASIADNSVDFVLTDPPYLVNYRDRAGRHIANDNDPRWMRPAFREIYRVIKPNSLMVCCYGWNAVDTFMAAWRAAGFRPVGHIVFAKRYASSQRFFGHQHEQAYLLAKGRPPYPAKPVPDVMPFPYTGNRLHPTEKPLDILRPLITAFSHPGDVVLDPFAGSGSTLMAARQTGRDYIGIELDAVYHAIATARLSPP